MQPDESLSSWRQRAAHENGFRWFPAPYGRAYIDPDRMPSEVAANWLTRNWPESRADLESASLDAMLGSVFPAFFRGSSAHWVIPIGRRDRRHWGGPSYCPDCLHGSAVPYFRLAWRFAFVTHCPHHHVPLIDECPACHGAIWPGSFRNGKRPINGWQRLGKCQECGQPLGARSGPAGRTSNLSGSLWIAASGRHPPMAAPPAWSAVDYFAALWVIAQMLIRRPTQLLWQALPADLGGGDQLPATAFPVKMIECLPCAERYRVVRAASWLLEQWPGRFVQILSRSGLSSEAFIATRRHHPEWMRETIEANLRRRRHLVASEVSAAIQDLRGRGLRPSKLRLRQMLKVAESREIHRAVPHRHHADGSDLKLLVDAFEGELLRAKRARDEWATQIRDYEIFLLSVLRGESVEDVCSIKLGSGRTSLVDRCERLGDRIGNFDALCRRVVELDTIYTNVVRPRFLARNRSATSFFLSRFGGPLAGHTVRARVSRLMVHYLDPDLWRSADAFLPMRH